MGVWVRLFGGGAGAGLGRCVGTADAVWQPPSGCTSLVERFNGHRWQTVYTASEEGTILSCVVWLADDDVCAGSYGFDDQKVVLRWDGTSWNRTRMQGPRLVFSVEELSGSRVASSRSSGDDCGPSATTPGMSISSSIGTAPSGHPVRTRTVHTLRFWAVVCVVPWLHVGGPGTPSLAVMASR